MKGRAFSRFHYDWPLYVAVAVVGVFLWYFAFTLFNAPAPTETINCFVGATVKNYDFKKEALDASKPYGVKAVELVSCDPSDSGFPTKYQTVAVNGCDVVVVPESVAKVTDCANTFIKISGHENVFVQEGIAYGVYLDEEAKTALSVWFGFSSEDYVAMIVASSPNSGGEALTDNALKFLDWLVHYGKG